MNADEIRVVTGRNLDHEMSLQDYCIWLEDRVETLGTLLARLVAHHPELFGPDERGRAGRGRRG
jgi:hypothetical protein